MLLSLSSAMDLVITASSHHASSSSSDNGAWVPLLFLLTGPAFFMYQYTRYRNKDKRHHHERETLSEIANIQVMDQFSRSHHGSSHSHMSGANENEVRG